VTLPTLATALALLLSGVVAVHVMILAMLSRRNVSPGPTSSRQLVFTFVIPCLNEEQVIGATVESLLAFDQGQWRHGIRVVVVDDDSDDQTAGVLTRFRDDNRVTIVRRKAPDARQGKGEALNAAYRQLAIQDWRGFEPIVCIVDADGRLDPTALDIVGPYFTDTSVGGVQIGVRIRNAASNLLARLQDAEFVLFTDVFQTGRNTLSSPSLGGNGQFVRLSALTELGDSPWSSCLTEDLELGLRLIMNGHVLRHCDATWVDQQGLVSLRRWIRQRTRWFQGHLQCQVFIPRLARARSLPLRVRADLIYHLLGPMVMLVASVAVLAGWTAAIGRIVAEPSASAAETIGAAGIQTYLLAFAPGPLVAWAIWRRDASLGLRAGLAIAHLYVLYSCLWFIAGWTALIRTIRSQASWAKTERVDEGPHAADPIPPNRSDGGSIPIPAVNRRFESA
jgi:cellulose synthase/poly-beta-1,6-N-acetylglucosamine synthase-like glycosyltransferase